jgi:hypothetical protein
LASSDICESVIGKEKLFSKKSPLQEIGKSILMSPVFLTGVSDRHHGRASAYGNTERAYA